MPSVIHSAVPSGDNFGWIQIYTGPYAPGFGEPRCLNYAAAIMGYEGDSLYVTTQAVNDGYSWAVNLEILGDFETADECTDWIIEHRATVWLEVSTEDEEPDIDGNYVENWKVWYTIDDVAHAIRSVDVTVPWGYSFTDTPEYPGYPVMMEWEDDSLIYFYYRYGMSAFPLIEGSTLYPISTGNQSFATINPYNNGEGKVEWPFFDRTISRLIVSED